MSAPRYIVQPRFSAWLGRDVYDVLDTEAARVIVVVSQGEDAEGRAQKLADEANKLDHD